MPDALHPRFDRLIRHDLSVEKLRVAIQADRALRAEAEAELAATNGIHPDRCIMTKEYGQALQKALA